jgi:hypothetical protein
MPRFYFNLRASGTIHRDLDGTELPDFAAACAHGLAVTEELMRCSGADTRHWSMCVEDATGRLRLDLFFADLDPDLDRFAPQTRMLVSETCRRLGALTDALCTARATRMEARMLLARARGTPQLVHARGE